jgi:S-DNA-T family DNA segregation ATPase FtsK/SpoIIIE
MAKRSTASKRSSSRRSSARKTTSSRRKPTLGKQLAKISKERKTDIIGALLLILAIISMLGFFGKANGTMTSWMFSLMAQIAGLGAVIFPVVLFIIGIWLIFRNEKRFPMLSLERLLGIVFLYLNILTWMHWFGKDGWDLAKVGGGGGYLGAIFERLLVVALGYWGAFVVILAWTLLALAFTFDVSIPDLFRGATRSVTKTGRTIEKTTRKVATHAATAAGKQPQEKITFPENGIQPEGFQTFGGKKRPPAAIRRSEQRAIAQEADEKKNSLPDGVTIEKIYHAAENKIDWKLPVIEDVLDPITKTAVSDGIDQERARIIEETLASFNAPGHVVEIHRGPTFTQFGIEPDFIETRKGRVRVRVNRITSLTDDLALALAAHRIRVQAPVPGRRYIGIEVPNAEAELVTLREGMQSKVFARSKSFLKFVLGKDVAGKPVIVDMSAMPHLLIAGTTGSGKSVCINAILCCMLMNHTPNELRFVMVDPKRVELTGYNGIPHLLTPVIVDTDKVVSTLQWMSREMDSRYKKFSEVGARNIEDFNAQHPNKLPYIIVVIDELADLMMLAPEETERNLNRLAQLARATGIHVIIATQRPSVDVITGMIKANFPARISFKVVSLMDSRVILDQPGAERLIGLGDMLFQAPDAAAPKRLQGVFLANHEIQKLVRFWTQQDQILNGKNDGNGVLAEDDSPVQDFQPQAVDDGATLTQVPLFDKAPDPDEDPLLGRAIEFIRQEERASISMLQRKLKIGYTRAARMIDRMEEKEIIGTPSDGSGIRPVLDFGEDTDEE